MIYFAIEQDEKSYVWITDVWLFFLNFPLNGQMIMS